MEVISIYARLDGEAHCPFCGDACGQRGYCATCHGCFLCCWSHVHCLTCDLPDILCGCLTCEDDDDLAPARRESVEGAVQVIRSP
jgi:hypothetical protein